MERARPCCRVRSALFPLLLLCAAVLLGACEGRGAPRPVSEERQRIALEEVLGGAVDGFAIAEAGAPISFPRDHGSHPDFRSEWWYLTGNLSAPGREFGYQLTIFRTALAPEPVERASDWATRQLYMGHLAIGDFGAGRFRAWDRFARGAVGLAGAELDPFRVWIEDWEMRTEIDTDATRGADTLDGLVPLRVRAREGDVRLDLLLTRERPIVLQGDAGFSRKGARPENASHYYSATRLRSRGTLEVGGESHEVEGLSWLDREWSTSALESVQVGWDWFALQLSDGSDLMLYVMRRADGSVDPHSSGVVVGPDGVTTSLRGGDYEITVLEHWTSPATGVRYPSRWRLRVPALDLQLDVAPRMAAQELDLAFRYWEGAVEVSGVRAGEDVAGRGFVELTGYGEGGV